ncbi:MAG: DUF6036 family nucleotidyltransferase [Elusimicrobiota bacterium]
MALIKEFLKEIDARWKPIGGEPFALQVIGSAALMLQTDYDRGTKDGDVLESSSRPAAIKEELIALAGKETDIHKQFRIHIDVVNRAILFLPQRPAFHPLPDLELRNFKVEVLDVTNVVLSKIKRYNSDDKNDIRAMAEKNLLNHKKLIAGFKAAADWFSLDARAADVPYYLKNLHKVERDILGLPESDIELPPECMAD